MHRIIRRLLTVLPVAAIFTLLVLPGSALAHERRTIGNGKYDVTVGWDTEPAYADMKNGASIRIMQAGTQTPVADADKTLKVQIRQGASSKDFPLRAVFGQAGYYVADIVPTRDGDYVWTFTGAIGSDQINEKFDTADGKFNAVQPQTALQFPVTLADPAQANAALESQLQSTRTLAYVGIGVGVIGVLLAVAVWLTRPRTQVSSRPTTQPASERA
jgi:hypothetical protein